MPLSLFYKEKSGAFLLDFPDCRHLRPAKSLCPIASEYAIC